MKAITNSTSLRKSKIALAIGATLLLSAQAMAAEEPVTEEKKAKGILEVIEVTARKRTESIQSVPGSVSAVTGEHIQNMGIHNVEDLAKYVPGLEQPKLANHSRLVLRGVSSGDNQSFEQSVGTYVDGVYRGRMNQQRAGFFDMQRVEVLKGPQVTLYGNSSIGGALSMHTMRPEVGDEINGDITVKYETEYEESQVTGGINVPVTDEFAMRIAGKYRDQSKGAAYNAYTNDDEPTSTDEAFRVSAVWQPSDDLNVYVRHEQGTFERNGNNLDVYKHINGDGTPVMDSPYAALGMDDGKLFIGNDDTLFKNGADGSKAENDETMLEVVWDMSDTLTLTSVSAISNYDYFHTFDVDITPLDVMESTSIESYEQISQELRLDININDKLDLMTGFYYQDDDFDTEFDVDINPAGAGIPLAGFSRVSVLDQNTEQKAIFGQVDYQATDKLSLTLGARYTEIEKTADQALRLETLDNQPNTGPIVATPFGQMTPIDFTYYALKSSGAPHEFNNMVREEEHTMINASVKYQLSDDFMVYASYADGAKTGGFDTLYEGPTTASSFHQIPAGGTGPSAGVPTDSEFEDEEVQAFELGFKSDWDTVRLNVAAFYGEYDNLQVSIYDGVLGFNVGNAATSIQKGVDAELSWQVTDNLSLIANAEYLDFYYDEFVGAACSLTEEHNGEVLADGTCDWSGDTLAWVPEFKALVAAEHVTEIFGRYELSNLLSVSYKSEHTTDSSNDPGLMQDGYALVDYRLKFAPMDSNWHVAITATNLLDEEYETYISKIPLSHKSAAETGGMAQGGYTNALHEGRRITLEAGYSF